VTDTTHTSNGGPVLFAYDGSEQAKAAIREAARQLKPGRHGIALTVCEPLASYPFVGPGAVTAMDLESQLGSEAGKVADEGAELARSVGFDATALAETGDTVGQAIVRSADEHDAGLVVMGSHGRSGIGLVLLGSVAATVARHSKRPLMIVHAPPAEDAG
jgi:nucleotide-binding universal stress UspA family protein